MKRPLILLLLLAVSFPLWAQTHTINGTVTDKTTGETLIGATVLDVHSGKGTVTNSYGRYSLTLPQDSVQLKISFVGYETYTTHFYLSENRALNADLSNSINLKEVVISAERPTDPKSSQMSAVNVPVEHIKSVPVLFGETDILKVIQLLPGVQSGSEGMSGIYVRGGGPDENLFLLDGVPLYNVNHLGGFFSAFNSDAVKNVTLYKGSFPAHFGGRLSSVLDITTNNGNDKKIHGGVSVGLISAKVFLEGPIIKEKTTFSISARRTYADALLQPFLGLSSFSTDMTTNAGYYFYDLNAKVTHKFSDRSRLFVSYYMGDDVIYLKLKTKEGLFSNNNGYREYVKMGYNWGNIVSSLRWNYVLTPKLFMNITGAYTRYRNNVSLGMEDSYFLSNSTDGSNQESVYQETNIEMSYKSGIQDYTGRVDFDYAPNSNHNAKFGGSYIYHTFTPDVTGTKYSSQVNNTTMESIDTTIGGHKVYAHELTAYAEDDWTINNNLKINYGVALSGFSVDGTFYPSIQPRLSGRFMITDELSFKAGYAYMTQYMHLLSNSSISLPTDLWVPVTAKIPPMTSHQVAAGFFYNFRYLVDLSVEGYYKRMNNLMEYKDGASFWGNSVNWEDKVCLGEGWAYGVEFLAQRTVGKYTGWVGYTWSHTNRLFNHAGQVLSNGEVFPAKYDRRHDISVVLMYKPNDHFDASITWVYSTGNTATLALQEFDGNETSGIDDAYGSYSYYQSRNNFRMPAYHRMDASVNFHKQLKHGTRTLNISVYNLYNHKNPYILYEKSNTTYTSESGQHCSSALVQLSIFPIIPSISYIFQF